MSSTNKNTGSKIRAKLFELWTRLTEFSKDLDVYLNGEDNQYPSEMERVINNSPSASRSAKMMTKFLRGSGIQIEGGQKDPIVNKKKNLKLSDIVDGIATDISKQYGCYIHTGYKVVSGKLKPGELTVLDYCKCRIGKEDQQDNAGKIFFGEYEEKSGSRVSKKKKKDAKWYYPFNSDEDVIISQIKADAKDKNTDGTLEAMLPHYRGQVFYLNLTPNYTYAISLFDGVFNDCDTEYRMSLYSNTVTRGGFLGKLAVVVRSLDEEEGQNVEEDIVKWLGAEESGNIYYLEVGEAVEDISKVLHIEQIETQYNEKQFIETRKSCRTNILGAANNIPEGLVYNSSGLFAQSGESYKQMKIFYNEQTQDERSKIEDTLKMLGYPVKIIPLIEDESPLPVEGAGAGAPVDDATREAQAALRGSVGGVQGILGIQQSVSQKLTDFESAVTILMEIYGFSREVSQALLGQPVIEKTE